MNESIEINSQLIDEAEFDPDRSVGGNLARQPEKSEGARKVESRRPVGLLTEQQLKEFSQRSDGIALVYTLTHYSLIGLLGWIIWMAFPSPWCVPVLLIQAFVIGFLFSPLHECSHGTAFRSRWPRSRVKILRLCCPNPRRSNSIYGTARLSGSGGGSSAGSAGTPQDRLTRRVTRTCPRPEFI